VTLRDAYITRRAGSTRCDDGGVPDGWELDELAGELVRLRAPTLADLDAFERLRDSDGERHWGQTELPRSPELTRAWLEELVNRKREDDTTFLVVESHEGEVVGSITVGRADRRNGVFSYGIGLTAPHRRKGFGTEAMVMLLRFYFGELGYQRCETVIYSFNEPSLTFHRKLGFIVEGTRRRSVYTRGAYHDVVAVGMLREEFEAAHGF
jgi:RimJ/RimL family protein N-acetyltransferase